MNGEPLGPDHGAPFRLVVPHWYAVASVKWLKRIDVLTEPYTGEFQTGHYMYEWADRPPEPVDLMRVRARITDPAPGVGHRRRHLHRARQGLVGNRTGDPGRGQPHRRGRLARGAARAARRPLPVAGLVVRLGRRPTWDGTPSAPGRPTRPGTCNRRSRPGTGSATGTTPSRSSTSTCAGRSNDQFRPRPRTPRRRVIEATDHAGLLARSSSQQPCAYVPNRTPDTSRGCTRLGRAHLRS